MDDDSVITRLRRWVRNRIPYRWLGRLTAARLVLRGESVVYRCRISVPLFWSGAPRDSRAIHLLESHLTPGGEGSPISSLTAAESAMIDDLMRRNQERAREQEAQR